MKTDPVFLLVLLVLSGIGMAGLKLVEWLYRPRSDSAPSPESRALAQLALRLGGGLRWDSPYEAVVLGRSEGHGLELRAWLGGDMPVPDGEPALRVALLLESPLDLGGRARTIRIPRGGLNGVTLARGAQPAIESLLFFGLDEVVISAARVEARVWTVGDAGRLLDLSTLEGVCRRLQAVASALGERPKAPPSVSATERVAAPASTCPYCRTPVDDDPEACPACATLHHGECLREHGRCTVLGCRGRPGPRVQERA